MFTGIRGIIQMSLNEEQMLSVITRCSEVSGACRCLERVEVLEFLNLHSFFGSTVHWSDTIQISFSPVAFRAHAAIRFHKMMTSIVEQYEGTVGTLTAVTTPLGVLST